MNARVFAFGVLGLALVGAMAAAAPPHALTVEEFGAGCSIPPFAQWPADVRAGFVAVGRGRAAIDSITGPTRVTSAWRPTECNARRDGEDQSRHLRGWAIDLALTDEQTERLLTWLEEVGAMSGSSRARARAMGDAVRALTGWRGFVGLRIYPSGSVHLDFGCPPGSLECDPRRADWLDVQA